MQQSQLIPVHTAIAQCTAKTILSPSAHHLCIYAESTATSSYTRSGGVLATAWLTAAQCVTVLLLVYMVYSLIVCLFAVESTDCGCDHWLLLAIYKHTLISCGASCCILTVHEERARI